MDYGVRYYDDHPERQKDYFSLQSADSRAVLQRERHGTLLVDNERKLDMYLRGLWQDDDMLIPYSSAYDELRKPIPYYDKLGIRLPDVYDDAKGVTGLDRYRAALAHIAGHRRWTTAIIADNLSPFQRMAAEFLEDSRVEYLAMREYPGLRRIFMALHPIPAGRCLRPGEGVRPCAIVWRCCRAPSLIRNIHTGMPHIIEFAQRFHALMNNGEASTQDMADLAVSFIAKTRLTKRSTSPTRTSRTR